MRMDLAGDTFQVGADYQVKLPPSAHLIVIAGAHLGEPGYDFDHPNVAVKKSELFEFKHYHRTRGKFWTSKPGISFYFVLPKAQIELLPEKGYSYVPVLIHGRKCRLNVSGGGDGSGWTDYVGPLAHIGCGWSRKDLKLLAEIAVSPAECQTQGITLAIEAEKDFDQRQYAQAAAAVAMRAKLKPGSQVMLSDGYSYQGSQGPLEILSRPARKRYFVCKGFSVGVHVQYAAIDWIKTAEANCVTIPGPILMNRITAVLEPTPT